MLVILGVSLLVTSCRTTAYRKTADPSPAVARLRAGVTIPEEADRLVRPLVEKDELFGVIIGIITPSGETLKLRYGSGTRRNDSQPPDTNSIFQVGSVSKVFLSALLAKLVAEGEMRYDETVRSILPKELPVSEEVGNLTVYELLTHTGGFNREPATLSQLGSFLSYLVTGQNLYRHLTKPYVYRYLRTAKPKPRQSREFEYSNLGIGLLGNLIEVKTGHKVTELIETEICRPLGMHDSVFRLNEEQQARLAVGHTGNQACWKTVNSFMPPWDMGEIMTPSGGMFSTLDDFLIFAKANLGMLGHPLEPVLASTHSVRVQAPGDSAALGWIVNRFEAQGVTITFKHGMVSGYCAYIGFNLEKKIGVVVLCNRFDWDEKVGHNLVLRLSGAFSPEPLPRAAASTRP